MTDRAGHDPEVVDPVPRQEPAPEGIVPIGASEPRLAAIIGPIHEWRADE